ncbi:hypothetical protein FQN49_004458 [Arthroderma sp. PD_2]|nr:hypothetical protein FQN49_004458 [Arthroderma sp. PD_2]
MEPAILLGLFTFFAIYGLWHPIPLTTVGPYSPLPVRIAGTIQLTATTNSALSLFRNVMWPVRNSTSFLDHSLNGSTLILQKPLEDFLLGWEHKLEEHMGKYTDIPIPTVTTCTPTPTLKSTVTNTVWPEYYTTHPEYDEWVGYTLYWFVKQEAKRNPNMYTAAILFFVFNYWLVLSARRLESRQKLGVTSVFPADGPNKIQNELAAHNIRLNLIEAKVDGLLSTPASSSGESRNNRSSSASERISSLKDTVHDLQQFQEFSTNQSERLKSEFESLQEKLTKMRRDIVSLKEESEARSERSAGHISSIMDMIKELKEGSGRPKHVNPLADMVSVKESASTGLKPKFELLQEQITELKRAITSKEESDNGFTEQISFMRDMINELKKDSEKRKNQLVGMAAPVKGDVPAGLESELELLQEQITNLRQDTDSIKEESESSITEHVASIRGAIKEQKKDCERAKQVSQQTNLAIKEDVSNLKSEIRKLQLKLEEPTSETSAIDIEKLKASLVDLQQDTVTPRALDQLSTRLEKIENVVHLKPWSVEGEKVNSRISTFSTRLQALESSALADKSLLSLQDQLDSLSSKLDYTECSLKELTEGSATKFEHKSLLATVTHLEDSIEQWKTIPQKAPIGATNEEDAVKLVDLKKSYLDLISQVREDRDAVATLISSDIPKQRTEDYSQLTKVIEQSIDQLGKKIASRYARVEDVRKCLNILHPEGDIKPIDLVRLKKKVSDVENFAYSTENNLMMAKERITDSEQRIETLREGNATNYKDIRRCLGQLGLSVTTIPLTEPINPKPVPTDPVGTGPRKPVHIDMSVGRKAGSLPASVSKELKDQNISRYDPRYKGDDKLTSHSSGSSAASDNPIGTRQKENFSRFDPRYKGNDSNPEPSFSKGSKDTPEVTKNKNISRYDPRYQEDDKFKSSSYPDSGSPGTSKGRGKLNPKAEVFGNPPKGSGNGSLASRVSFAPSTPVGGRKLEVDEITPANKDEHSLESPAQPPSSLEGLKGGTPGNEERKEDSSVTVVPLDVDAAKAPLAYPESAAEKLPEESPASKPGDSK